MVGSEAFLRNNPATQIIGLSDGKLVLEDKIKFTEFAPMIFRNIRKKYISEKAFYDSFIPTLNPQGIFKFKTGQGRSPSFFFFTDNGLLMLKTLKSSEKEILFQKGFLLNYFKHLQ